MKKSILISALLLTSGVSTAGDSCLRECTGWDTFCKNPAQIVATKVRLGVPVKHEQAAMLGIPSHYLVRGGGSLVEGLPCSTIEGKSTVVILEETIKQ